jgi:hypothetical protein
LADSHCARIERMFGLVSIANSTNWLALSPLSAWTGGDTVASIKAMIITDNMNRTCTASPNRRTDYRQPSALVSATSRYAAAIALQKRTTVTLDLGLLPKNAS